MELRCSLNCTGFATISLHINFAYNRLSQLSRPMLLLITVLPFAYGRVGESRLNSEWLFTSISAGISHLNFQLQHQPSTSAMSTPGLEQLYPARSSQGADPGPPQSRRFLDGQLRNVFSQRYRTPNRVSGVPRAVSEKPLIQWRLSRARQLTQVLK